MPFVPLALAGPDPAEITRLLVALGVLLVAARVLGELARKVNQPSVLGELVAGVLLGPALLGRMAPEVQSWLFPTEGPTKVILDGIRLLAVMLFLLVAGLEVDFSRVLKQGRAATSVGILGIGVPFLVGFVVAWFAAEHVGWTGQVPHGTHALFFATALSISALPVIAKTLIDLHLYRSDFGMVVIASAIFDDLAGWMIFAVILGMAGAHGAPDALIGVLVSIVAFTIFILTLGRRAIHRALPWIQAHTSWPSGVLVFAIALALFGGALTERAGLHAIFGAFLTGVALGDSSHLRERTRTTIREFVSSFFAPLFFAGIGVSIDFVAHFDVVLCIVVMVVACLGKIGGAALGARIAGMDRRESWAIGFAMNARGSMEIVLGLTALKHAIIDERMFVALVVMALLTSVMSGPLIQRSLGRRRPRRFARLLSQKAFVPRLSAANRRGVVRELSGVLARATALEAVRVDEAVWTRELVGTTAIGHGIAIPHARVPGLAQPLVAFGLSTSGVDFDAPDGQPARLVFLILTPAEQPGAQLEILADISRTLKDPDVRAKLVEVTSWTELLAALRADVDAR
jgi:Kef-type K+ transport system membrane component KefB/mannitol/fructose-specific phosphotransferase system IIA component (Ntr-type)